MLRPLHYDRYPRVALGEGRGEAKQSGRRCFTIEANRGELRKDKRHV